MASGLGVRAGAAALLGLALVGVSARVLACIRIPGGWTGTVEHLVPANGVIIVRFDCPYDCPAPPDPQKFVLSDATGNRVSGTVVLTTTHLQESWSEFTFAYKPEADLLSSYTAELEGSLTKTSVFAREAVAWREQLSVVEEPYTIELPFGTPVCCDTPSGSCAAQSCYQRERLHTTGVNVSWLSLEQFLESGQYAYRVELSGHPVSEWTFGDKAMVHEDAQASSTVCYTLELRRLVDGFVHRYAERCVERPTDLGPIGVFPAIPEALAPALSECQEPSPGDLGAWCQANAVACAASAQGKCANFARHCAASGGAANGGASNGGASAGNAGTLDGAGAPQDDRYAKSCTCSASRGRPENTGFGLLAFSVGVLFARHRARRIPPARR